jgi:hypothetical protein
LQSAITVKPSAFILVWMKSSQQRGSLIGWPPKPEEPAILRQRRVGRDRRALAALVGWLAVELTVRLIDTVEVLAASSAGYFCRSGYSSARR